MTEPVLTLPNPVIELVLAGHVMHTSDGKAAAIGPVCPVCRTAYPCAPILDARRQNTELFSQRKATR